MQDHFCALHKFDPACARLDLKCGAFPGKVLFVQAFFTGLWQIAEDLERFGVRSISCGNPTPVGMLLE
jgi:hypothetical protein